MVTEMDSHQVAGTLDRLCEFIIHPTRTNAPTGMIMAENDDGGIVHDSLLHDDADVNRGLSDTKEVSWMPGHAEWSQVG